MDPRVVAAFARHGNLMTRRQAVAEGVSVDQIDDWVRRGRWVSARRGVYTSAEFWESLEERRERPLYLSRAASLAMRKPHVRSHDSAALELGMQILKPDPMLVHVTRSGVVGSRTEHGVKHHKAPYRLDQVVKVDGWPVLDAARTAADIAREHGYVRGVVAFDSALRAGATREQMARAIEAMRNWPGVTQVRAAEDLADLRSANVAESLGKILVTELGFGRPEPQFGLSDGSREVWCDLRLGRHFFEIDGAVKYVRASDGGYAEDPGEALWAEKVRQDFVTGFKTGVSRIVWADFWGDRRTYALERLRREYLDTVARFGDSIADLEPYRIRRPPYAA